MSLLRRYGNGLRLIENGRTLEVDPNVVPTADLSGTNAPGDLLMVSSGGVWARLATGASNAGKVLTCKDAGGGVYLASWSEPTVSLPVVENGVPYNSAARLEFNGFALGWDAGSSTVTVTAPTAGRFDSLANTTDATPAELTVCNVAGGATVEFDIIVSVSRYGDNLGGAGWRFTGTAWWDGTFTGAFIGTPETRANVHADSAGATCVLGFNGSNQLVLTLTGLPGVTMQWSARGTRTVV